jgi:acetyltransferase-like isoleucine patch superfamily enzyme
VTRPGCAPWLTAVGRKMGVTIWPELLAVLRTPLALDPPAPGEFARFGERSWMAAPARVDGAAHIAIGSDVIVMEHAELRAVPAASDAEPLLLLGDGTRLARFATVWATVGVVFGSRVSTSDGVAVIDSWLPPGARATDFPPPPGRVTIGDGAYLGAGCVVGPGVAVGRGAYVAEGAVVDTDVPPNAVVRGNPARIIRRWTADDGWQAPG